ncbi:MAG: restriction endonuclease subunit M, partial [Anaerolineae bacterium]|nr:restriction endonuclease subunit M [Anaerolineae bacterium]
MPIPASILDLVQRFDLNRSAYHAGQYNEAQVRQEFINPFWAALGWDVYNAQGYSEKYKEVVHEDALQVSGRSAAPDYAFRLGGQRVFFVEAKKPAVHIKTDISPAYQLRRYAWSAKLPLSILTDFEEFAVYDCRIKPVKTDQAAVARVMYLTYQDYADHWDEIAALFGPEAIRKGALDRYAESNKAKKGTAEVDAAFLAEIEGWRDVLARNIALRNPGLSVRELNRAVQMTIDRLIFLRICEDRGIEPYGRLRDAVETAPAGQVYAQLGYLFRQADDRYNSGLFHFKPEKGRGGGDGLPSHDDFTLKLSIDDKTLKPMVSGLYYPDCPYEFSVLPADILGQVYEQFLGKVIRLTSAGRAKVEEKPEVKKAGGVYYTPTYIVDYIVRHTVGKLLEGKTPRQVWGGERVAPLRLVDPACGAPRGAIKQYLKGKEVSRKVSSIPQY